MRLIKYYFCFVMLLLYGLQVSAQCPVIEGAMINACGTTEGINEFLVFSTTASATVSSYTLYYGSNSTPSSGSTAKLSGADATTKTGSASITSSCSFTNVTSPSTVIPANSRVVFIPSDFDNSYDLSNLCSGNNLYVVYIKRSGSGSTWATGGNFSNSPSGNRYLQLVNSANSCSSGIVSYNNSLLSASDGDFVSWTSSGTATGNNNGCTTLPPVCTPPTALVLTGSSACGGTTGSITSGTSTSSISYQLYNSSGTAVGSSKTGTGSGLTWPGIAAGTGYYVIGTNTATSCTSTSNTASVVINSLPTISGTLTICGTGSTTLTGSGTAATTNPWTSGTTTVATVSGTSTTGSVTGVATGTSIITYKDNNGCTSTATVTVNALPTISGTLAVCSTGSTTLTGSGTAASTSPWTSGTTTVATVSGTSTTGSVTGVATGTSIITYKDNNGCTSTATVTVNALPTITVSTSPACATNLLSYSLGVTVSTGNVTGTNGTVTNTSGNVWAVSSIATGTNTVVTVTDANTCSAHVNITAPNCNCASVNAPVSGGNKSYCSGSAIPSIGATVGTGETVDWYSQSTGGTPLLSNSLTYTPTTAGTYYAEARNTTTNCTSSSRTSISITINAIPTISGTLTICGTGTTTLTGSGTAATSNPWTSGTATVASVSGTSTTGTVTGVAAGTSNITYKDNNGCSNTATVTVNAAPTAAINYTVSSFCKSSAKTTQAATLWGTGNYTGGTYTATPGGLSIDANTGDITPGTSTPGTYTVIYSTNANGCTVYKTNTTITITEAPTASISYKASPYYNTITAPQAVTLTGETGGTFTAPDGLTIDANTGAITPSTSDIGTYTVTYTIPASGQCAEVLTTATVEIVELLEEVYIPQGFSPNGDGVNDYFVINNIEQYPHNHIVILNRWGDKVYESTPYTNGWDGQNYFGLKMGTDPLPIGTYFYILDLGNKSKIKKGSVYLSR